MKKKLVLVQKWEKDPYKTHEVFVGRRYLGRIARYENGRWYISRGENGRYQESPSYRRPSEAVKALEQE